MTNQISYHWTPEAYINLVEHTKNPMLLKYQQDEAKFIQNSIQNPQEKTFIDVGAGYGRVLPSLSSAKKVIAVEKDDNLFGELEKRASTYSNIQAIQGDANQLNNLLTDMYIPNPVVFSLQNSLGTWEGDYKQALQEMKKAASGGELIVSLLKQAGLETEGIPMYKTLVELVGKYDPVGTDLVRGIFRSKNGYKSQWWTKEQREEIKEMLGGTIAHEQQETSYCLLHITYW